MNILLLIDGNAIMHRAFHALPPLTTRDGIPTNAVYGFFTMVHKALQDFQATHVIVCFDTPKPTFRKEMHKEYQAHRPKMINEMGLQFPIVKDLLDAGGIKRFEKPGYEADDVIGTLTEKYKKIKEMRVFILTGDKDIMQLVDKNVFVMTPVKGLSTIAIYSEEGVKTKLGVEPKKIPDLKALMGDSSDNYKGAKGIGPKTAVKLLDQFGTVENLLKHIDDIKEERTRGLIQENIESVEMSKQLATIMKNVGEVDCDPDETKFNGFNSNLREELEKLQLFSLIGRLFNAKNNSRKNPEKPAKKSKKELYEEKEASPQLDLF